MAFRGGGALSDARHQAPSQPLPAIARHNALLGDRSQAQQIIAASNSSGGEHEHDAHRDEVAWLRAELRRQLEKKDKQLEKKDEQLEKKDEQLERFLKERDEQLDKKDAQLESLRKEKDGQLEKHRKEQHQQLERLRQEKDKQLEKLRQEKDEQIASLTAASGRAHFPEMTTAHEQQFSTAPPLQPPTIASSPHLRRPVITGRTEVLTDAPLLTSTSCLPGLQGKNAEAVLSGVLEAALETLEALLVSTPRKQRQAVKAQCESVENILEELDSEMIGRLAVCDKTDLTVLSEKLDAVQALRASEVSMACVGVVGNAMVVLRQCCDVVISAVRQMTSTEANVRMRGLQALRALPRSALEEPRAAEASAAALVAEIGTDEGREDRERVTALLGLIALCLRNGEAIVSVLAPFTSNGVTGIFAEVLEGRLQGREGAMMAGLSWFLETLAAEVGTKCSDTTVRASLEGAVLASAGARSKLSCSKARYEELLPLAIELATKDDDVIVACAATGVPTILLSTKMGMQYAGVFLSSKTAAAAWALRRRVVATGLPLARWKELSQTLSLESMCVAAVAQVPTTVAVIAGVVPQDGMWPEVLAECIHLATIHHQGKLSNQGRYTLYTLREAHMLISCAARDPAHHAALLPCAQALLWTSANGFKWTGTDVAEYAATACVSLLGRNEGGLTLSKETVASVMGTVHDHFDSASEHWLVVYRRNRSAKSVVPKIQLVIDMVVAGVCTLL
eukprot:COSAG05_NODE_295_length_11962_cov_6.608952_11_plen_737_part_00